MASTSSGASGCRHRSAPPRSSEAPRPSRNACGGSSTRIFDAYEREGAGLESARLERARLPLLDEWFEQLDVSLDALVAEALRPRRPDPSSIASVRALTDVTMWRALRDQGASPDASVQQASAVVEGWLEARTAGASS